MEILNLEGNSERLYRLVAHLVMDEEVLEYNLNYPYRTSPEYHWFIATEQDVVTGFIPVRINESKATINNYYVADDDQAVFSALLKELTGTLSPDFEVESITQTRHIRSFEHNGFSVVHYWKRYVKMRFYVNEKKCL